MYTYEYQYFCVNDKITMYKVKTVAHGDKANS